MEIINFILGIVQIITSIISWPFKKLKSAMKIENINIKQVGNQLDGVKGLDVDLENGEKMKLKNINIEQRTDSMKSSFGMKIKVSGKQEAELENINIETPIGTVKVSKGVTINKQPEK
ncbi:MAG: hypothetical protein HY452_01235 [Parcubacteria group bacterium]|nr:hypothetical protein [Parcubacteria group bacterium]